MADGVVAPGAGDWAWADWDGPHPVPAFCEMCRPVGEYNGCTPNHLPKNVVAMPASLAARIAFSSFPIRWLLR